MALVWSDARFATGVDEVDAQHRALFDMANELLEATRAGRPAAEISAMLEAIGEHAKAHFACEEDIMERRNCSSCLANKLAHRWFLQDFAELGELLARDGVTPDLVDEMEEKICDWLEAHLLAIDLSLRGSDRDGA
jgi:hemerythrin